MAAAAPDTDGKPDRSMLQVRRQALVPDMRVTPNAGHLLPMVLAWVPPSLSRSCETS